MSPQDLHDRCTFIGIIPYTTFAISDITFKTPDLGGEKGATIMDYNFVKLLFIETVQRESGQGNPRFPI